MPIIKYYKSAERPDITLTWRGNNGAVLDLSVGYSFELKIGSPGSAAIFTKTAGINGAQTSPNLTISFISGELDDVPVGLHAAQLRARETAGSQDRYMQFWFLFLDAVN